MYFAFFISCLPFYSAGLFAPLVYLKCCFDKLDFMNKVNAMDVRGAMKALMEKGGTNIGVGRQSIVNHTVNNNQRITQNINTNNPNFAGARMGRFVGAL